MTSHLLNYLEDKVPTLDAQLNELAKTYLWSLAQLQLEDHTASIPEIFMKHLRVIKDKISFTPDHKDDLIKPLIWYYGESKNHDHDAFDLIEEIFDGRFTLGLRLSGHNPIDYSDEEVAAAQNHPKPVLCETDSLLTMMQILIFRQQMAQVAC